MAGAPQIRAAQGLKVWVKVRSSLEIWPGVKVYTCCLNKPSTSE